MNTNQDLRGAAGTLSASSILSSFLNKKEVTGNHRTEEIKEPITERKISPAAQILNRLQNKKETAAINLGITAGEVETMPFDLSQLETEGIFLNIDCRGFSTLERQIEWKSLGIELPPGQTLKLSPPRVGLLPDVFRRKLLRAASQAHHALNKYSFRFTLCETIWGTSEYKWIPWNAFENFEQEYKNALETLAVARAEVLAEYDEILLSLRRSFAELAEDSAKRLDATMEIPFDQTEFIQNVIAHALGMIPTREMIRDGLTITMKPKVIVLGSEMLAEQQRSKTLHLQNTQIDAATRTVHLEIETKTKIEQLKFEDFELEQRREREVKERIRRMKLEAAKDAANEAISPIKEGLDQITAKIFEAAEEMVNKLNTADFVPGALAKRARQMCEWYRLMNFTGDTTLEEVLQRLQRAAGGNPKHRSKAEIQSALNDVLRMTSLQSKRLLDDDRLSALEL